MLLLTEEKTLSKVLAEDQYGIHLNKTKCKITKNEIRHPLEGVASVPEAKGHTDELVHAKGGDDGSLLDVFRGDRKLVPSACRAWRTPGSWIS